MWPRGTRPSALGPVGRELVAVGLIATAFAVWWPSYAFPSVPRLVHLAVASMLALGLGMLLSARAITRGDWLIPTEERDRRCHHRRWSFALALLTAAMARWLVPRALADVQGGIPAPALLLAVGAIVLVLAGALLSIAGTLRQRSGLVSGSMTALRPVGPTGSIAIVLLGMWTWAGVRWPVHSTEADAIKPPVVPAQVSGLAWRWQAPGKVREVVAAGAGVAVLVPDGVIALDGATGAPRWEYRRRGAIATAIGAAADGSTVVVHFDRYGEESRPPLMVSIDAMTGEVQTSAEVSTFEHRGPLLLTSNIAMYTDDRAGEIIARDLVSLEQLWQWKLPSECADSERIWPMSPLAARDVVLTLLYCVRDVEATTNIAHGEVVLLALDERTGRERWRHTTPYQVTLDELAAEFYRNREHPHRLRYAGPVRRFWFRVSSDRRAVLLDARSQTDYASHVVLGRFASNTINFPAIVFDASTGKERWRGSRSESVVTAFDSRVISRLERDAEVVTAFDSRAISRLERDAEDPWLEARHDLTTGAIERRPAAASGWQVPGGGQYERDGAVLERAAVESCIYATGMRLPGAWGLDVSPWPHVGPRTVFEFPLGEGVQALSVDRLHVTAAPGVVAIFASTHYRTRGAGKGGTDTVIGLR